MPHIRTTLRNTISDAMTGVTAVTQTYQMRTAPYDVLPAINIKTLDEAVRWDMGAMDDLGQQVRELRLRIEVISWTLDDENDDLDSITEDIDTVLTNSQVVQDSVLDLNRDLVGFEYDRSGDYPYGVATMTYSLLYVTDGTDPNQTTN